MRPFWLIVCLAIVPACFSQDKPAGLRVSTWVREDLFAGYLDGDMTRYAAGVQKLDRILQANPKAADAVAWQAANHLLTAARALAAGNNAAYAAAYATAQQRYADAAALAVEIPVYREGVHAITGGSFAVMSDRLSPEHRLDGWRRVATHYAALRELQKERFAQLPDHLRGEVLAGLAQSAQRLGNMESARKQAAELAEAMPGTPYAVFARRWLDKPEMIAKTNLTCVSCHEPGRLQAVLAAAPKN